MASESPKDRVRKDVDLIVNRAPTSESRSQALLYITFLLGAQSVLGFVLPGLLSGLWACGFFKSNMASDLFRGIAMFLGASAFLAFKARSFSSNEQKVVCEYFAVLFAALGAFNVQSLASAREISFLIFLHFPINALLAFIFARQSERLGKGALGATNSS